MPKKTQASVAKKDQEKSQEQMMVTSKKIQEILESDGFALQPFLIRSEYGDRPSVRLVEVPANQLETNVKQDTDTGKTESTEDTAEPAEATQS